MPTSSLAAGRGARNPTRQPLSVLDSVRAQRDKILRQLRDRTILTTTGCLEWRGVREADKRARITIRVGGRRTALVASRVVWALHYDEDPGWLPVVRTVCGNPACLNIVEHCELGTIFVTEEAPVLPIRAREDVC